MFFGLSELVSEGKISIRTRQSLASSAPIFTDYLDKGWYLYYYPLFWPFKGAFYLDVKICQMLEKRSVFMPL